MTDRLQGGMKHAPGVLCIVTGIPRDCMDYVDNGKTVVLTQLVNNRQYKCPNCKDIFINCLPLATIWGVEGKELLACPNGCVGSTAAVMQKFLLPIGDSSLIEGEKWEHSNPKEDMMERAIALVNGTYKSPYPLR